MMIAAIESFLMLVGMITCGAGGLYVSGWLFLKAATHFFWGCDTLRSIFRSFLP